MSGAIMTTNRNRPNALKQNLCEVERPGAQMSKRQALMSVGRVVYAARLTDGCIKIGCTSNLYQRLNQLAATELLGFTPGDFDDEALIHAGLVEHQARGREYYHPTAIVLEVVNEMRERFNLPALVA
jgi:hypothetical protein